MVSWSLDTLVLAFWVIAIICSLYIAFKATQARDFAWTPLFLLGPLVAWILTPWLGALIAGVLVLATQFLYVRRPYNWHTWGRIWVYVVICWAGSTVVTSLRDGWFPRRWSRESQVVQSASPVPVATEAMLDVDGGRIWYRRSGMGPGTPVVLLHGGPGTGSFYLKSLEALGDDRVVVRYDQLGAGHSEHPTDSSLFAIPRFVAELDSLRSALGVERMHLVGHSWGAALALEYYRAHPERIASLTFASPALDMPAWAKNARRLLAELPDSARKVIVDAEALRDYDSPDYQAALAMYNERFVSMRPEQADLDSTRKSYGHASLLRMWGPSDFTVTGTLRTYDATRQLRRIAVPVLYTVGASDQADTLTVQRFAATTPGAQVAIIPDAAHITTWDNPAETLRVIREFLRAVDAPAAPDSTSVPPSAGTGG